MATFTQRTPASTYKNLLNIDNSNSGIDSTSRQVQDGEGTTTELYLSTASITATFANSAGLRILDSNASHYLIITTSSNLTDNRTLTFVTGDADRSITLTGNYSMSGAFNLTHTITADTNVTYPTTGTLATLSGSETLANKTLTTPNIGVATGTSFNSLTGLATQAEMETATSTVTAVSPGRTQYHPGVAKAWVKFTGVTSTTIAASYNVASLTDNGTGDTTVNIDTDFSANSYAVSWTAVIQNNTTNYSVTGNSQATSAVRMTTRTTAAGTATDVDSNYVVMFGDQT